MPISNLARKERNGNGIDPVGKPNYREAGSKSPDNSRLLKPKNKIKQDLKGE